uniref:DUF4789 domain-containing protein n=1 Tax=Steinernema glaseri TaxID=37863 RepID=A0A1I7ZBJ4_9BILA
MAPAILFLLFLLGLFNTNRVEGHDPNDNQLSYRYTNVKAKVIGRLNETTPATTYEECGLEAHIRKAFAFEVRVQDSQVKECRVIWQFDHFTSAIESSFSYFVANRRELSGDICEDTTDQVVDLIKDQDFHNCAQNDNVCNELHNMKLHCEKIGLNYKNCFTQAPDSNSRITTVATETTTQPTCLQNNCSFGDNCHPTILNGAELKCCGKVTINGYPNQTRLRGAVCCPDDLEPGTYHHGDFTCCPMNYKRFGTHKGMELCCPEDTIGLSRDYSIPLCCVEMDYPQWHKACCPQGFHYRRNMNKCFIDRAYVPSQDRKNFQNMKKMCERLDSELIEYFDNGTYDVLTEEKVHTLDSLEFLVGCRTAPRTPSGQKR